MADHDYKLEFTNGAPGMVESALTFGIAPLAHNLIGAEDGWYCRATDRESGLHATIWGLTQEEAQNDAMAELDKKMGRHQYEADQEEKQRQRQEDEANRKQYRSTYKSPETDNGNSFQQLIYKLIGGAIALAILAWIMFKVVLPVIVINASLILLIAGFTSGKSYRRFIFVLAALAFIYLLLDYKNGWLTYSVVQTASFLHGFIVPFLYLNIVAALVAAYFVINDIFIQPMANDDGRATMRNYIAIGSLVAVFVLFALLQIFAPYYLTYNPYLQSDGAASAPSVSATSAPTASSERDRVGILVSNYNPNYFISNDALNHWDTSMYNNFILPGRKDNPDFPYIIKGDFNGNGTIDIATMASLKSNNNSSQLYVFMDGSSTPVVLSLIGPIQLYPKAQLRQGHTDAKGDGISSINWQSSSQVNYWNGRKWVQLWTGD